LPPEAEQLMLTYEQAEKVVAISSEAAERAAARENRATVAAAW